MIGGFLRRIWCRAQYTHPSKNGIDIHAMNTIIKLIRRDKFDFVALPVKGQCREAQTRTPSISPAYLGDGTMNEGRRKTDGGRFVSLPQPGSGFKIAMRDLQIRGAGTFRDRNKAAYGYCRYAMYCKIMRRAGDWQRTSLWLRNLRDGFVELNVPALYRTVISAPNRQKMDSWQADFQKSNACRMQSDRAKLRTASGKIPKIKYNLTHHYRSRELRSRCWELAA